MERYAIPTPVARYVATLYSRLNGRVRGPGWITKPFEFKRGVFQGDPLSPTIFLMCFNPVLEYLKEQQDQFGYKWGDRKIITTPYADDFNLITGNKLQHQKLMNGINDRLKSMGLTLKPRKCSSLFLTSGKPNIVDFTIGNDVISSVHGHQVKFLGSLITFSMKTSEIFEYLKGKIESTLENINKCNIRNEYKVCILTRYALPSLRYMLIVHDVHATHLKSLDIILDRYIKIWLGIPSRGANIAVVHDPDGLNIPSISDLYRTCHCLAYSRSRVKGDDVVNHALDRRLERERGWSRLTTNVVHFGST